MTYGKHRDYQGRHRAEGRSTRRSRYERQRTPTVPARHILDALAPARVMGKILSVPADLLEVHA